MNQQDMADAAKRIYPTVAKYVAAAKRSGGSVHQTGLCAAMGTGLWTYLDSLLGVYRREQHDLVLECGIDDVPFNCTCCDEEHGSHYWKESFAPQGRINNPYRRAFINWVCRQAGKPELLP